MHNLLRFTASLFFKSILEIIRFVKSCVLIFRIKSKGAPDISFASRFSGLGRIETGLDCVFTSSSNVMVAKNSCLSLGDRVLVDGVDFRIGGEGSLSISSNVTIMKQSELYVSRDWFIGDNCIISTYCSIFARESQVSGAFVMGQGSQIGDRTIIDVSDNVLIGENVAIGTGCVIYTHNHVFDANLVSNWQGGVVCAPVVIGNGSWIGSNAIILPGVVIGDNCTVGAGTVVSKSIPAGSKVVSARVRVL